MINLEFPDQSLQLSFYRQRKYHYISNLGVLSHPRQKQLLSIILDTNLHIRNRLIFSCTQAKDGHMPHAALEYTNMLGCVPLPIKPLREQKMTLFLQPLFILIR